MVRDLEILVVYSRVSRVVGRDGVPLLYKNSRCVKVKQEKIVLFSNARLNNVVLKEIN